LNYNFKIKLQLQPDKKLGLIKLELNKLCLIKLELIKLELSD